jgi:outer membrane protein TolC
MLRLPNGLKLRGDTGELTPLTYISPESSMTSLVTTALNRRPELRSREAMLAASRTDAEGTRKAPLYPDVTVRGFVGGFGGGFNSHTGNFDDVADGVIGIGWRVGPGGLFDRQRSTTADSLADQESVLVEKTRQRITREVLESVAAVRSMRDRIAISEKLLAAAEKAYTLTRERGKQGIGGVLETLRSEEDLSFARLAYFDLITESNIAQTQLRYAMGLGGK